MPSRLTLVAIVIAVLSLSVLALDPDLGSAGSPPFVVDTVADTVDDNVGNNICSDSSGNCSLRAAIQEADAAPEVHDIHFDGNACGGTCTIEPGSALPALSRNGVRIDGTTHSFYNGSPQVRIFGTSAGAGADGLTLTGSGIDVAGLAIFDFSGNGITINGGSDYLIEHNIISNHGAVGVFVNASNASLISNHIGGNPTGIYTIGDGHIAHFNSIFSNGTGAFDEGFTYFLDAENNWWGCNEGPNVPFNGCDPVSGPVNADPWLVLSFDAFPDSIPGGGTSALTASLTDNSDGFDMSGSGLVSNGIPVTFETTLGSVGSSSVVKSTTDGTSQVTLTANEGPGVADLTASASAESVAETVTITSAPPSPSPTLSPTQTASPTPIPTPTPPPTPSPACPGATAPPGGTCPPCPGFQAVSVQSTCPPTASPAGAQLVWGDNNCSQQVDPVDSLFILRGDAGLTTNTGDCPDMGQDIEVVSASPHVWGDIDCTGQMTPVDSLKTLRYDAGLSVSVENSCPEMGSTVTITE